MCMIKNNNKTQLQHSSWIESISIDIIEYIDTISDLIFAKWSIQMQQTKVNLSKSWAIREHVMKSIGGKTCMTAIIDGDIGNIDCI